MKRLFILAVLLAAAGAVSAFYTKGRWPVVMTSSAVLALSSFIVLLWISLGRPPLKTMGETRLWYSFFALISGLFTYLRWRYKWILSFSTVLATVFIMINILKPEIHDQSLMPALQSPWFIPHVTVYIYVLVFSYGLRIPYSCLRTFQEWKGHAGCCGYPCIYRYSLHYLRYAFRFDMGQGGMGSLLELGP